MKMDAHASERPFASEVTDRVRLNSSLANTGSKTAGANSATRRVRSDSVVASSRGDGVCDANGRDGGDDACAASVADGGASGGRSPSPPAPVAC